MSDVLTPPEIAARWRVDPETVLSLLKRGDLVGFTTSPPGSRRPRWRVTLQAVEAFEAGKPKVAIAPRPAKRGRQSSGVIEFY